MRTIAMLMAVAAVWMASPWHPWTDGGEMRLAQNVGLPPTPALNPRLAPPNRVELGAGALGRDGVAPGSQPSRVGEPMLDPERLGAPSAGAVPPAGMGAVQRPLGANVPPQPGSAVAPPASAR